MGKSCPAGDRVDSMSKKDSLESTFDLTFWVIRFFLLISRKAFEVAFSWKTGCAFQVLSDVFLSDVLQELTKLKAMIDTSRKKRSNQHWK